MGGCGESVVLVLVVMVTFKCLGTKAEKVRQRNKLVGMVVVVMKLIVVVVVVVM